MRTCQRCDKPLGGSRRKWCSENCRKRAWDDAHRAMCGRCGSPLSTRSGWAKPGETSERCALCERDVRAAARRARVEDVAEMYREGMTQREIARELGYGPNSIPPEITEARRLGLIGYRNRGYGVAA